MICGKCKDRDQTVEHVRACYAGQTVQAAVLSVVNKHVAPVPVTVTPLPVSEEGIYFTDNTYFKVVFNLEGTRLYAKTWDGDEWAYDRGAIHRLTADMKVTAEQAAQFGALTGACVFCSRRLTDERSVTVGYGPVCADKAGLPWG